VRKLSINEFPHFTVAYLDTPMSTVTDTVTVKRQTDKRLCP